MAANSVGEKRSDDDRRSVEEAPTVASDSRRSVEEAPTVAADSHPSVEEAPTLAADSGASAAAGMTLTDTEAGRSAGVAPTVASGKGEARSSAASMPRVARGDTLDQFVVLDEIGRGGMGVVVAAHDPDLDRKVAIKILRPGYGGTQNVDNASARLRREAQAMAKLAHPNVITVHQVGTRGAEIYVVMEYVAGGTLRQWVQKQERSWREVLATYLDAGRGLAAAHKAGLVHRDFKPDNVLIDEEGRVRVTDFGLVGRIGEEDPDAEETLKDFSSQASPSDIRKALTRPGEIMGTPYYMAPEQHKGSRTDASADQFAFCVSLYEALYDQRPFAGDTYQEVAYNAIFEPPAEPPTDTAVPERIHEILLRGMSKRPADRYADMEALLAELAVDPTAARRRMIAAGAAAAVLLVAAGSLWALWPAREDAGALCERAARSVDEIWNPQRQRSLEAAFAKSGAPSAASITRSSAQALNEYTALIAKMRKEACVATRVRGEQSEDLFDKRMYCLDGIQGELDALLSRLERDPDARMVDTALRAITDLQRPERCADIEWLVEALPLPSDPDDRQLLSELKSRLWEAEAKAEFGEYEDALAVVQSVMRDGERLGYAPLLASALYTEGSLLYQTGDLDSAEARLREAIKASADAREYYLEAQAWITLIYVVGHLQERPDEGLAMKEAAEAAIARADKEPALRANLLNVEGLVLLAARRYDEAASRLQEALDAFLRLHEEDHLDVAVARNNLANALQNLERYGEARAQLEKVIAIREKQLDREHPDMATALNDLGLVDLGEGKLDDAETHLKRAVEIRVKALGETHPRTADAINNLALCYQQQGRLPDALATYQRALAAVQQARGENHVSTAPALANIGSVLSEMGQSKPAWEAYAKALAIVEYARGHDDLQITPHVENLAKMLTDMGLYDDALSYYARSLAIREKALGATHFWVGNTLVNRGAANLEAGRFDAARSDFERARTIYAHYYGPTHKEVAQLDFNLGVSFEREQKYSQAIERYTQALQALEASLGEDSPELVNAIRGLGDVAHAKADYAAADAHFARIVAIQEKALGAENPALADPLTWRGTNLMAARDWAKAVETLSRAFESRKRGGDDAALVALNQFLLAQALWGSGKRAEGRRLAGEARRAFVAAGDRARGNVEEVDTWLRKHR